MGATSRSRRTILCVAPESAYIFRERPFTRASANRRTLPSTCTLSKRSSIAQTDVPVTLRSSGSSYILTSTRPSFSDFAHGDSDLHCPTDTPFTSVELRRFPDASSDSPKCDVQLRDSKSKVVGGDTARDSGGNLLGKCPLALARRVELHGTDHLHQNALIHRLGLLRLRP